MKGERQGQHRDQRNSTAQDGKAQKMQTLQQQNLLQLLQQQSPNNNSSQLTQRLSVHPFPPPPQVHLQPLLPQQQQVYVAQPFSPHQQHHVRQQYLQYQRDINNTFRQQHLMTQQRQVVQPLMYPPGVQSVTRSSAATSKNQQPKGNNASKSTTSFVPTQVLSGGRGSSSSFTGRSKKQYRTQTASSNANVEALQNDTKDEFASGNEIPIEELLQEASKKLSLTFHNSTRVENKLEVNKSVDNQSHPNSGADLLAQLANNIQNFGISQPGKIDADSEDPSQPRKSRIAANFNFGP
jgi:hypothetical protein